MTKEVPDKTLPVNGNTLASTNNNVTQLQPTDSEMTRCERFFISTHSICNELEFASEILEEERMELDS